MVRFIVSQQSKEELGRVLAERRQFVGLTTEDLAKKSELNNVYIKQIEEGTLNFINPLILKHLSSFLNLNYMELYKIVGFIDNVSVIKYMIDDNDVYPLKTGILD